MGNKTSRKAWHMIVAFLLGAVIIVGIFMIPGTGLQGFIKAKSSKSETPVTRAEVAKILVEGLGLEIITSDGPTFSDVSPDQWYYPYVETAYAYDIINVYADGQFRPNATVTRAEGVKMVVTAFDLPKCIYEEQLFSDVSLDMWYSSYVSTAVHFNLFSTGSSYTIPSTFSPSSLLTKSVLQLWVKNAKYPRVNDPAGFVCAGQEVPENSDILTRAVLAKMVVEAAEWEPVETDGQTFSDVSPDQWYYPYVETIYAYDVINGYADGQFRPNATVTRAEGVKIITTAFQLEECVYENPVFQDIDMNSWYVNFVSTAVHFNMFRTGSNYVLPTNFEPAELLTKEAARLWLKNAKYPSAGDPDGYTCE